VREATLQYAPGKATTRASHALTLLCLLSIGQQGDEQQEEGEERDDDGTGHPPGGKEGRHHRPRSFVGCRVRGCCCGVGWIVSIVWKMTTGKARKRHGPSRSWSYVVLALRRFGLRALRFYSSVLHWSWADVWSSRMLSPRGTVRSAYLFF